MEQLFHIPTLMLCLSTASIIVSIFLTLLWYSDRDNRALRFWCLGFWCSCLGLLLLAFRDVWPPLLSLGFGNALVLWSLGLILLGCQAFDDRTTGFASAFAGGAFWIACFVFWPPFASDLNLRIIVASVLFAAYSYATMWVIWQGYRREPLPGRRLALFAFAIHGLAYTIRIPLAVLEPARVVNGLPNWWHGILTFEFFIQGLFGALAIFAMVHERTARRHKEASEIDALTGILNRRAFLDAVEEHRRRADRRGGGARIALLDIDFFKTINDTYGHGAGDLVLQQFAKAIGRRLPEGSLFGRIGGEEFAIYLPAKAAADLSLLPESLRADIASLIISFDDVDIRLTVSIGDCRLGDGEVDLKLALAAADRALYASKQNGRNRVTSVVFPVDVEGVDDGASRSGIFAETQSVKAYSRKDRSAA